MVDLGKDDDDELRSSPSVHPLLKDYNPHCDGMEIRPQFMNVKKQRADEAKQQRMSAAGAAGTPGGMPNGHGQGVQGAPQATPRRRRRRNPSEKAAAAAAMAAAAAAALQERKEKEMAKQRRAEEAAKATAGGTHGNAEENRKGASADGPTTIVAGHTTGAAGSPFSEEELKTLGSGDDEDIPAAKRAAMASAVALRAAAGGSPLDPPKSAKEVTFDIADPPSSPICPPSAGAVLESATLMTENDVLCGRGGGTNSQMGNRRFRALVRDFQPTYLMAKRREKPRMARSVVLIVRNRGGRFLRRDDADGRLYEVGDDKAEAKTSQALREGLDVRATKTAANTLMGTAASAGEPGGGARKRKQGGAPTSSLGNAPKAGGGGRTTRDGSGPAGAKREPSARPRPVHAPGYPPHSAPIPPPPGGPPRPGYYPSYPPMYDDPYRRSRYPPHPPPPPDARPTGYGSHPPPPPTAVHYHHHYGPGASGGPHYPPSYGGYPGAGAAPTDGAYPSPPRSSHKTLGRGGGSDARQVAPRGPAEAAFSPPRAEGIRGQQQQQRRPPPPPPDLTPVGSQRKVL